MRFGVPASVDDMRIALGELRARLAGFGCTGELHAEPGRWVVEPCGYWAARVAAVKAHPKGGEHRFIILDTSTPVPCRPSLSPFGVMRDGEIVKEPGKWTCDLFGSSNTALDAIGADVRLPTIIPGDIIVSLGQGAYTRSLIPPFNERERPGAAVV